MSSWLIHSNAPWANTGYGQQTEQLATLMQADGCDVNISAFWGLGGRRLDWGGMKVFPSDEDWGNTWLVAMAHDVGDGDPGQVQVLTLMDVWVLTNPLLSTLNLASWVPIDHMPGPVDPIPARVRDYFTRSGATPIAMSKFGTKMLAAAGLEPLYVPHSVDTNLFKPLGQATARQLVGLPEDAYIVGMVAANKGNAPPRKAFPQVFEAFARFRQDHPEALLYLHSLKNGGPNGLALIEHAKVLGVPEEALVFTPEYELAMGVEQQKMPVVYNCFDCLCGPSLGEGFGIPIVEAQACGVPVIVNNATAMPELVGHGWLTENHTIFDPSQGAFWAYPYVDSIHACLEQAYEDRGGGSETARKFALNYDAAHVYEKNWRPVLAELEQRREQRQVMPTATLNRRQRRRARANA